MTPCCFSARKTHTCQAFVCSPASLKVVFTHLMNTMERDNDSNYTCCLLNSSSRFPFIRNEFIILHYFSKWWILSLQMYMCCKDNLD